MKASSSSPNPLAMPLGRAVALVACFAAVLAGCRSSSPPPQALPQPPATQSSGPVTRPALTDKDLGPPIFEGRRGIGAFPLDQQVPKTPSEMQDAVRASYAERLALSATSSVAVAGKNLGHLDSFDVDLSGSRVKPEYKPKQLEKGATTRATLLADRVHYVAQPLFYEDGAANLLVEARGAMLHILRDKAGQSGVVLAGADSGRMVFESTQADFHRTVLAGMRKGGKAAWVSIQDLQFQVSSPGPRQVRLDLDVRAMWLALPMHLIMGATLEVDDQMIARYRDIVLDGRDPGGDMAAALMRSGFEKAAGKPQPLMRFMDNATHARDFKVQIDEKTIHIEVLFGR